MSDLKQQLLLHFPLLWYFFHFTEKKQHPSFSVSPEAGRSLIPVVILRLLREATKILRKRSFTYQPPCASTFQKVLLKREKKRKAQHKARIIGEKL